MSLGGRHWYDKVIVLGIIVFGLLYVGSYSVDRIEVLIEKYVATSPPFLYFVELVCMGAALGLGITLGFAPKSYLDRWENKRTARSRFVFRLKYLLLAGVVACVTWLLLYVAYCD